MNVTNLEMTQATIEIFGAVVCILVAIIVAVNGHKQKNMRWFQRLFWMNALLLFSEACAYIFRGNRDTFSVFMTQASNFVFYLAEFALIPLMIRYLYSLIEKKGVETDKRYKWFIDLCVLIITVILVLNIPLKWMYYFDAANYYHRAFAWYIMTVITMICLIVSLIFTHKYRKHLSKAMMIMIWLYELVPVLTIVVQIFVYGYSFTSLGIMISLILLLFVYLREWIRSEADSPEEKTSEIVLESRTRTLYQIVLFFIMVLCLSVSIIFCIIMILRISRENEESDNQTIAFTVSSVIENELLRPITVTDVMTKDTTIIKEMMNAEDYAGEEEESLIPEYLESIREGFHYSMVYAVCDPTLAFYTSDGYVKHLNWKENKNDEWYPRLLKCGFDYDIYADIDEDNLWDLSLFVNRIVRDKNRHILGMCGIGIDLDQICDKLREYEERYQISIKLYDRRGLLLLASDKSRIKQEQMDFLYDTDEPIEEFTALPGNTYLRYEEDLNLYLVIEDLERAHNQAWKIVLPSVFIFLGGIVVLGIVFSVFFIRERKATSELLATEKISLTDGLTGLWNRRALDEDCKEIQKGSMESQIYIIVMDMNGLKTANDSFGHKAGDELLLGLVDCMNHTLGQYGKLYRFGGDEFVAIMRCQDDQMERAMDTFRYKVNNWHGQYMDHLSVSIGIVNSKAYPEMTVAELVKQADKCMYVEKRKYYKAQGIQKK